MNFTIEHEREEDGRWLAQVPELPGVLAYGATAAEAMAKAEVLALRVLAERLENSESGPQSISIAVPAAWAHGLRRRPVVFSPHSSGLAGRLSVSPVPIRRSPVPARLRFRLSRWRGDRPSDALPGREAHRPEARGSMATDAPCPPSRAVETDAHTSARGSRQTLGRAPPTLPSSLLS